MMSTDSDNSMDKEKDGLEIMAQDDGFEDFDFLRKVDDVAIVEKNVEVRRTRGKGKEPHAVSKVEAIEARQIELDEGLGVVVIAEAETETQPEKIFEADDGDADKRAPKFRYPARDKSSAFSFMMENRPGSSASSVVSSFSKHSAAPTDADDHCLDTKKAKKSGGAKKKTSSGYGKRRTKPTTSKTSNVVDPQSTSNTGQVAPEEYVVEKIVGKKLVDDVPYYFIKWKGWLTASNTWEPVENLDGCPGLLEKYEKAEQDKKLKRRGRKSQSGYPSSDAGSSVMDDESFLAEEADSSDNIYIETEEMKKSRQELVDFGIDSTWPTGMNPVEVSGIVSIDGRLTYIVKCQQKQNKSDPEEPLTAANTVLIRASCFRVLFPHLVIRYYEKRTKWQTPKVDADQQAKKVARIMQGVEDREDDPVAVEKEDETENRIRDSTSETVATDLSTITIASNGELLNHTIPVMEDEIMEIDDEVDENEDPDGDDSFDLPKIFIRKDEDLFGLPRDLSDNDISSDEEFEEVTISRKKK